MRSVAHHIGSLAVCCACVCQMVQGGEKNESDAITTSEERQHDILGPYSLTLSGPIKRWDNAIPLGNGLTGGLLWGENNTLKLSLDRGDLWDERAATDFDPEKRTFATFLECYRKQDRETWEGVFVNPIKTLKWTKIPGGRLEIALPESLQCESFHLDFEEAIATVTFSDGSHAEAFFPANQPVALVRGEVKSLNVPGRNWSGVVWLVLFH